MQKIQIFWHSVFKLQEYISLQLISCKIMQIEKFIVSQRNLKEILNLSLYQSQELSSCILISKAAIFPTCY